MKQAANLKVFVFAVVNCYASVVYLAFFDKGEAQLSYRAHLNAVGLQAGTPTPTPTLALAPSLAHTLRYSHSI